MAIATQTQLSLIQSLAEANGDYISVATTTNIAGSSTDIISTNLNMYDDGADDYFNDWWCYLNTTNNAIVERKVSDYATATGTLTLYGANLSAESGAVTIYLFRYKRTNYKNAIIEACKEIYPILHVPIDDMTIATGNILPDASFESWSSSSALNWYTAGSATLAQTTTAGLIRGQKGSTSVKVTAGAASDYIEIDSDTYPRLLDLMDQTVNFYSWAYPEVADDCSIQIYTLQADGTAQTLTSTTSAPATKWTKLELEDQALNDDLTYIRLRWIVTTNTKYTYFDDAYLSGMRLSEYLLPNQFYGGHVSAVMLQDYGSADEAFYDIDPFMTRHTGTPIAHRVISDGTDLYLKLEDTPLNERRLRLTGYKPLETLSADTDTITLNNDKVSLLIAKAREIFWGRESVPVSAEDSSKFGSEYSRALSEYYRLVPSKQMPRPPELLKSRYYG